MSPLREPLATFQVGHLERTGHASATGEQQLSARFADHRGRIDLPALGVLFDHLGGIPFQLMNLDIGGFTIQARLSISAQGHVGIGERLTSSAQIATHDDNYATTSVEIRTSSGTVCCVGTARNVVVGRSGEPISADGEAGGDIPDGADADGIRLPEAIDPKLAGRDIVAEIANGTRDAGPLVDLLNGRVEIEGSGADAVLRLRARTEDWMGNMFGTMHGGVIATIVGQAASLAGQVHTAPGQDYSVSDLAVGFYRSPAVHGGEVIAEVVPIKLGRRIGSFDVTLTAHDGMLLSRGTADVRYG